MSTFNRREHATGRGTPTARRRADAGLGAKFSVRRFYNFRRSDDIRKLRELVAFLGLTTVVAPLLAVTTVAGYGFVVWALQIIAGPPTG